MTHLTIPLPDEQVKKLRELAEHFGLAPEEIARITIEEMLTQPNESFRRALDHVLAKNEELYRRLAT